MKTKKLFLMAAMLLMSVCSFAQNNNTPLKGDVNEDGKVDVADIAAVINIMKNGGGTTDGNLYFYVGTEKPTSLSQATVVDSYPAEYTFTNPSTTEKCYVYVLTNADKTVNFYDPSDPNTPTVKTEDTSTISGYKITSTGGRIAKGGDILIKITDAPAVKYFYVGTEKPTSLSQATVVDSYPAEYIYTNNSGAKSKIYVLTNDNKNVEFYNPQFNTLLGQEDIDTTTIPGYKIFETTGKTGNTGTIKIIIE